MGIVREHPLNQYENENMDIILYNAINYLSSLLKPFTYLVNGDLIIFVPLSVS